MRREVPILLAIALFLPLMCHLHPAGGSGTRSPATIIVDISGGGDHISIQAAVNAAAPGDNIQIRAGTYDEIVQVNKRLNITGAGPSLTILDGGRPDHQDVINLGANGIVLSGISTTNGYFGHEFGGITIRGSGCRVINCSSYGNDYGMIIWSDNNHVQNNDLSNNNRNGIHMKFCSGNTVENNTCNGSAVTQGIWLEGCTNNVVRNNTCSENYKYGISIYQSSGNSVERNNCSDNELFNGINVYQSKDNNITENFLSGNGAAGLRIAMDSDGTTVRSNEITGNTDGIHFWRSNLRCVVKNNLIHNNTFFGMNCTDSDVVVNATLNWWGSPNGPYHATLNPDGSGDNVSDNVDFIPWLGGEPVNHPPVLESLPSIDVLEDTGMLHVLSASDPDGDPLTWSFETDLEWIEWNVRDRSVGGIPDNGDVGGGWVMVNISDGRGGFDEMSINVTVENVPPKVLGSDKPFALEDRPYENDYASTDDGQGNITWSIHTNCTWVRLDTANGTLSGTPLNEDVGQVFVNLSVDDGNGGSDFRNFTVTVANTNDAPIGIMEILDLDMMEDTTRTLELDELFTDPDGDDLEFDVYHKGSVQTYVSAFGTLEVIPVGDWSGTENFTLLARDGFMEASMEINVTVTPVNDAPENVLITAPGGPYLSNVTYAFSGSANDPDLPYGDRLNYTWSLDGLGTIGFGTEIIVNLTNGTHVLRLSVTDTSDVTVWTEFSFEVRDPAVNDTGTDDDEEPADDDDDASVIDDDTEPADDDDDDDASVIDDDAETDADRDEGLDPLALVIGGALVVCSLALLVIIFGLYLRKENDLPEE
ncbi:MAG: NosD domain-containing protein [Thermoplasmatota archaeon]